MTNPATPGNAGQNTAPIQPRLAAEQVLTKLLGLIRNSKSIKDFTPEYLSKMMGVEFVTYSPGDHQYGEQVTPDWWYTMQMDESVTTQNISRFEFRFSSELGTSPDMTDICQIDFENFASELESMGFTREPYYDSAPPAPPGEERLPHGRLLYWSFYRPELGIQVYPRGEANEPHEKISHNCVQMVLIT